MPLDQKQHAWIDELLKDAEASTRLSDWEQQFMDDLRQRRALYGVAGLRLSDRQMNTLRRIEQKLYEV
jgi:hypothetical protein